jgi:hypothetical protein
LGPQRLGDRRAARGAAPPERRPARLRRPRDRPAPGLLRRQRRRHLPDEDGGGLAVSRRWLRGAGSAPRSGGPLPYARGRGPVPTPTTSSAPTASTYPWPSNLGGTTVASGNSFAAPHIAGSPTRNRRVGKSPRRCAAVPRSGATSPPVRPIKAQIISSFGGPRRPSRPWPALPRVPWHAGCLPSAPSWWPRGPRRPSRPWPALPRVT